LDIDSINIQSAIYNLLSQGLSSLSQAKVPSHTLARATAAARIGPRRQPALLLITLAGVVAIALLSVALGSVFIPPGVTLRILLARLPLLDITPDWPDSFEQILLQIRLPRVALVALTGAALACSGTAYQGLFRNPLADPYLIGVAAGAGLGAIVAIALRGALSLLGASLVPIGAFAGALITVALVYAIGRVGRSTPATTLLLAGVAIGTIATSIATFLLLRMSRQSAQILSFLLGGYGGAGWDAVIAIAPFTLLGCGLLFMCARPLNLLLFDEEQARQLGVDVERVTGLVVVAATLTAAAAVAFSGLIGFVGLVVPHIGRLLVGADHRRLLPLATLGGAGFLLLADLLARTVIAPEELPLGVVTALVGGPFFLWLLRRSRQAAFF
jgi:iron complex transport system permease protein